MNEKTMTQAPSRFDTFSLHTYPWGTTVKHILAAALEAVEPATCVHRHLHRSGTILTVGNHAYDLRQYQRVFLVSIGKAGMPMARAVADMLGEDLSSGIVIVKDLPPTPSSIERCIIYVAGHPVPDQRSVEATQHVADLLEHTTAQDLVFVLISGGGSALCTLPAPGITLDDMQQVTNLSLACGASINEINSLRKHVDRVKGGGMARIAAPATVATLILSDVVGNPLDVIASGPTVPDSSTFADAYAVLKRYALLTQAPPAIVAHIQAGMAGEHAETLKPGDSIFAHVDHVLIGSNQQAADAALVAARSAGVNAAILTTYAQGEARELGRFLAAIARQFAANVGESDHSPLPASQQDTWLQRPACLIVGGETTVTLRGSGHGGRNQEIALAAVPHMAGLRNVALVTFATDGGDGPTDAAGAVVTGETLARAHEHGLDPDVYLANNDSYAFFAALDDLLRLGPTNTNVNDLALLVWF